MKESQRDRISSMDDFEDLTLFINESFDTEDVDLFEFTSEESSPLTKLKSIILSLDWEISDDFLQEMEDELDNLNGMWQGDKIAEVYLQGLSKIGYYIRAKGAYAHPNSIKLLLTFFYNFEKIISSTQITGEEITKLIKSDVRKFKILQYQINQNETEPAKPSAIDAGHGQESIPLKSSGTIPEQDICKQLKAVILSVDWEVTNENLRQFNEEINALHTKIADNKPALILIQGLQALGDYIADERADSHPDSFVLLHSFSEALEKVIPTGGQQLNPEHIQDILVNNINRLNHLKMLIVAPTGEVDDQKLDQVFEELNTVSAEKLPNTAPLPPTAPTPDPDIPDIVPSLDVPAASTGDLAAELDTLFPSETIPAMESANVQYPDEVLPPDAIHPVDDELADDFIESQLSSKRGLMPALSDADETTGFNAGTEFFDLAAQSDLAGQLDSLFTEADGEEGMENIASATFAAEEELTLTIEDEPSPPATLKEDEEQSESDLVVAALSDAEIPVDDESDAISLEIEETDFGSLEIQNKLDSFFAHTDEEQSEPVTPPATEVEEIKEVGSRPLDLSAPSDQLAGQLDFFFAEDVEETDITLAPFEAEELALAIEDAQSPLAGLMEDREHSEDGLVLAALSDAEIPADDESGAIFLEIKETDSGSLEIQGKLDDFFADTDEEQSEPVTPPATEAREIEGDGIEPLALSTPIDLDDSLDFFFPDDVEEADITLAPLEVERLALTIEEEQSPLALLLEDKELSVDDSVIAALSDAEVPSGDEPDAVSPGIEEMDFGSLEIQSKLDSFFADADEKQHEPAAAPAAEVEEIEHNLFFNEASNLQTALADSNEEQGFSEENERAALSFTPMEEIEEKLNLFFGSDDEDAMEEGTPLASSLEESLGFDLVDLDAESTNRSAAADLDTRQPGVGAATPPEVDELTMALEATIDDQLSALPTSAGESREIQLAALGALLPRVVRTPSRDNLAEVTAMIATCKQADLSPVQHSLLQLLESTLVMLLRLPIKDHPPTEKLVNYLYGQLIAGQTQADALPEVIGRFTAWVHEAGRIMPAVGEGQLEPQHNYTTEELHCELSELRAYVREMRGEFAKLQHEMQHHR
ncbi:MAG: hypothetical protein FWD79_10520 [Desulfobulbus sp.]|nr:hypothetical protein [Desulfobulbus sp.]